MNTLTSLNNVIKFLSVVGLILSFFGSLLIAFSVKENPNGHSMINGKKFHFGVISYKLFRAGIIVLAIGFIFQLFSVIC